MNMFKKQTEILLNYYFIRDAKMRFILVRSSPSQKHRIRTMNNNGPTMRDVAKQADVSLGTASNVLNNKGNVSAEVRNRVLSAVNTLGYKHPVRLASLSMVPLSVLGVISKRNPAPAINPFYSHVLAGIDHECQRHNLSLM